MLKRKIGIAAASTMLTASLFTVPTFANDSNSGSSNETSHANTSSTTISVNDSNSQSTEHNQEVKVEQEANTETENTQEDTLNTESNHEISNLLKSHEKHSDNERQKKCQAAEHGLETKLKSLAKNATAFQNRIDKALNLAISFQKDHNVTVSNFDQLVTAAQTAQSQAATSVSVLNGLSPNLDCSQNTVATNVAKFKVAAKQARSDLLKYKESVKEVLQALDAAKEGN